MDNTPHDKRFESWITSFLMRTDIDRSSLAVAKDFQKSSESMVKSLRCLCNQADADVLHDDNGTPTAEIIV